MTAPDFDAEAMADLEDLFGRTRLLELLGALDREIAARFEPPSSDHGQLARDAHVLVSSSGALAFSSLSQACARLEQACLREADVAGALGDVLADAGRARTVIAALRAA